MQLNRVPLQLESGEWSCHICGKPFLVVDHTQRGRKPRCCAECLAKKQVYISRANSPRIYACEGCGIVFPKRRQGFPPKLCAVCKPIEKAQEREAVRQAAMRTITPVMATCPGCGNQFAFRGKRKTSRDQCEQCQERFRSTPSILADPEIINQLETLIRHDRKNP